MPAKPTGSLREPVKRLRNDKKKEDDIEMVTSETDSISQSTDEESSGEMFDDETLLEEFRNMCHKWLRDQYDALTDIIRSEVKDTTELLYPSIAKSEIALANSRAKLAEKKKPIKANLQAE